SSSSCSIGERPPGTTCSHFGSDGCAITRTATSANTEADNGPDACASTASERSRRASAASANEESGGCDGCIERATSGRIVHDSECDSSKRMRAMGGCDEGMWKPETPGRAHSMPFPAEYAQQLFVSTPP